MENNPHTHEPQMIATLIGPALSPLQSRHGSFDTQEEADAAWRRHRAAIDGKAKMKAAGFPSRAIESVSSMYGPGLDAAKAISAGKWDMLFLIGDRGPGKTQIATYLANDRILAGDSPGLYRKAMDLWGEIRATWDSGKGNEHEILLRYKRTPFLVIDEAQERGDTQNDRQWCDRMFTHLIDHRYDAMLPTVICANLDVEKYESTIPASIRSRVSECGGVKLCDWPSYRTPK